MNNKIKSKKKNKIIKMMKWPDSLKSGSRIAIVSPAGHVSNPDFLQHVDTMIKEHGYVPVYSKNHLAKYEHYYSYAGTIAERLDDLQHACDDPSIDAIWTTRGGYGSVQLLEKLDLRALTAKPKWLIGYSDITYLHCFFNQNGIVSIHGHNVIRTLSKGVAPPASSYDLIFQILAGKNPEYKLASHALNQPGRASGVLIGGNQTIVGALSGTGYNFNYQDAILFLEEVGENAYYRIDRQMQTLEASGALSRIKGIIIGSMRDIGAEQSDFNQSAYNIIHETTGKYNIPKIFAFPAGHVPDNRPLIMGANITMEVTSEQSIVKYPARV